VELANDLTKAVPTKKRSEEPLPLPKEKPDKGKGKSKKKDLLGEVR